MVSRPLMGLCSIAGLCALVAIAHVSTRGGPRRQDYKRPDAIPYSAQNPFSQEKAELGRILFHDPILSASRTISCASCHDAKLAWGDGKPRAIGEAHTPLAFRAPTLLNVAWTETLGWDGKFPNLEAVAFTPITAPANMNMTESRVIGRLTKDEDYVRLFAEAFEDKAVTRTNVEEALATFERSIVSGEAPFDRWVNGDDGAIDGPAKRGFDVFNGKGRCFECHSGWAFTDGSFHDIGTAQGEEVGRGRLFPTSIKLKYAFKTPTLRDVALRAPYMHNGSIPTLEKAIDLYDRGGIERPSRADLIRPLGLTPREKDDLIAFLKTLTSRTNDTRPSDLSARVSPDRR